MKNENSLFRRFVRSEIFKVLLLKWDAVTVSLVSIWYGTVLIRFPALLDNYKLYDILTDIFNSKTFGCLFIVIGVSKILSVIFNSKWLKIISISLLVGLWILFGSALMQNSTVNTIYIHSFGWATISFGVAIREWVD